MHRPLLERNPTTWPSCSTTCRRPAWWKHFIGEVEALYRAALQLNLEGIVAKRVAARPAQGWDRISGRDQPQFAACRRQRLCMRAFRDISEQKRFEKALQGKNLELASANDAKGRFLASAVAK